MSLETCFTLDRGGGVEGRSYGRETVDVVSACTLQK